ncbi:TPA: hypothetical protein DIV55_04735 [Patescibacteria group bacterium]|nr:hypothetical protein [Patescibacteria group bacterium]
MKHFGIFDPYLHILGGAERYILAIAQSLSSECQTVLFTKHPDRVSEAQKKFGFTVSNLTTRPWPDTVAARLSGLRQLDLLLYVTDGSLFISPAKKNLLLIQTPAHIPKRTLVNSFKLRSWQTILCYSQFMADIISRRLHVQPKTLFVPVSNRVKKIPEKENSILSVGRFFPELHNKKQKEMVDIFRTLVPQLPKVQLYLVGSVDPGGENYLESVKAAAQGLPVNILTNSSYGELCALYAKAKIYWHATGFSEDLEQFPEKAEHFGVSTIEAMSYGCVPVVFGGGGQKEIVIHGKNGFIWNYESELVALTQKLFAEPQLTTKLAKAAHTSSASYGPEIFNLQLHEILAE